MTDPYEQNQINSDVVSMLYDNIRWSPENHSLRQLLLLKYNGLEIVPPNALDVEIRKALASLRISYATWLSLGSPKYGCNGDIFEDLSIYLAFLYGQDLERMQGTKSAKTEPQVPVDQSPVQNTKPSVNEEEVSSSLSKSASCPVLKKSYNSAEDLEEIAKTVTEEFTAEWETVAGQSQETEFLPHYMQGDARIVSTPDTEIAGDVNVFDQEGSKEGYFSTEKVKWASIVREDQDGIYVRDDDQEEVRVLDADDLVVSLPSDYIYTPGAKVWMVGATLGSRFKSGLSLEELIQEVNGPSSVCPDGLYITEAAYEQFANFTDEELSIVTECERLLTVLRKNCLSNETDEDTDSVPSVPAKQSGGCAQQ